jgi:hypothetical protein
MSLDVDGRLAELVRKRVADRAASRGPTSTSAG